MDRGYLVAIPLLCLGFLALSAFNWTHNNAPDPAGVCVQPAKLVPRSHLRPASDFFAALYANQSAEFLGGAIRIPTQSFDDMGQVNSDPRWAPFHRLHKYLLETFPKSALQGNVEFVNDLGLLYTFKGAAAAHVLKPALLMAHLDVVPVNNDTRDQWGQHDPFSGDFDGEWIYGRGAGDAKNSVVGILEAIESLLSQNWRPARTIVVAFGFDEEIGGFRGSGHLSSKLLRRYGPNSFELVLDEGVGNFFENGLRLACPQVTERGYVDLEFAVSTPGGHSSLPPGHTGIGILSELIVELEDNSFPAEIKDCKTHPAAGMAQCIAKYSPEFGTNTRNRFLSPDSGDNLDEVVSFLSHKGATQFMIRTSQALDIVNGGVKINALPELVSAWANYRTSIDSSPGAVYRHVEHLALGVAHQLDVGLISNGTVLSAGSNGNITISVGRQLEAAPLSPTTGPQWDLLGGTMRHIFEDLVPRKDSRLVISPSMMTGNTDTRHYWSLSPNIYRYSPVDTDDMLNYHTINERLRLRSHLSTVAFYYELLQNLNEW